MRRWDQLLGALALVSCGGSVPHPPYSPQVTSALTAIAMAPPPGRIEVIPKRPNGADAWVDGEWVLQHGRWYWLLGRWVRVPEGATYSPWVMVRASDGTAFYAPSVWRTATGAPMNEPPPPLAVAAASGEAIVGAEGNAEDTGRNIKMPAHSKPPTSDEPQTPEAPPRP